MNSNNPTTQTEAPTFFPFQSKILCSDRHLLNGHRSALVWFTGLSGSGKSTLAHALEDRLYQVGVRSYEECVNRLIPFLLDKKHIVFRNPMA